MHPEPATASVPLLDDATALLVRVAGAACGGSEGQLRLALSAANGRVPAVWMEEVLLQNYLFAGFPRGLNGMREWRRISGVAAPSEDEGARLDGGEEWARRGEATCSIVYGPFYDKLRVNIAALHPALDAWMIVEGYGKVLSRPGLDLGRRELCIVAACAVARQDRQLHSHLHGALHAGATAEDVSGTLAAVGDYLDPHDVERYRLLWSRVRGGQG